MEKEGGAGILGGMGGKKWLCNMYRHAIVGYRDHSLEILKVCLFDFLFCLRYLLRHFFL